MDLLTRRVKGTEDILPGDSYKWQFIENIMREESKSYGFLEMRTPVFEHTELFERGVGENTDVVQKEMYTFETKGDHSITLRPEGTAGLARAFLEHGLYNERMPFKVSYFVSCYRYEQPQAGRLREFHQFGVEIYGTEFAKADAELICCANAIFNRIQIRNLRLEINSIGCHKCRESYYQALKEFLINNSEEICEICQSRIERNPMRALDCKNERCVEITAKAPVILDYLCEECKNHFEKVKEYLDLAAIPYVVNGKIVRGLDYYTKTVFEFVSDDIGAQSTVCGGGRYDGLIEELGGRPTAALGFALGMERLMMLIENQQIQIPRPEAYALYVASFGEAAQKRAFEIVDILRRGGLLVSDDIVGRGLRPQLKYADKIGAKFSLIIGESEIERNSAQLKNMSTGEVNNIVLDNRFFNEFINIYFEAEKTELLKKELEGAI